MTPRQQDQANVEALRALNLRNANRPRQPMGAITTTRDIPAGSAIVYDRETNALTIIGPDRECIIHAKPFA